MVAVSAGIKLAHADGTVLRIVSMVCDAAVESGNGTAALLYHAGKGRARPRTASDGADDGDARIPVTAIGPGRVLMTNAVECGADADAERLRDWLQLHVDRCTRDTLRQA